MNSSREVQKTIELSIRASYGRLLGYLSSRSRDIQSCEDALSDAFAQALTKWTADGIPNHPEAWLLTVAKNRLIDQFKHSKVVENSLESVLLIEKEIKEHKDQDFQDDQLKLLFVCAHPSIDESARTALMLQVVLGLPSDEIASSFLSSPAAMSKKLTRAKQKIKEAGISFNLPESDDLQIRLEFVLDSIFAAYGKSWDHLSTGNEDLKNLDHEALFLATALQNHFPQEPEVLGLHSFLLFCDSRKKARRNHLNQFVPLENQNSQLWDQDQINMAEKNLLQALSFGKIGRFQLEAAIQSAHCARIGQKIDNWKEILNLYRVLVQNYPTAGGYMSYVAAYSELHGPESALQKLTNQTNFSFENYQPYWVLKAELHKKMNSLKLAQDAIHVAIGLTEDNSVREFLRIKYKM